MSRTTSIDQYDAQKVHLERALNNGTHKGVTLNFDSPKQAIAYRIRCYNLRKLDRTLNAQIYPVGDPLHNKSTYDTLILRVCDNTLVIYPNIDEPTNVTDN